MLQMRLDNAVHMTAFFLALFLIGCESPASLGPLEKGQAVGSLNGKDPNGFPECSKSDGDNAVFDILDKLAEWFGGNIEIDARCGVYERELTAGVTLSAPLPSADKEPNWIYLGGSGDLMADAMLCLIKDIGEAPGGKITRKADTDVGGIGVAVEQTVGLSEFDAAAKRARLYQQVRVCAPIIGCFDTQRQTITAEVKESAPAWPGGMKSGDYPIANSYSLDITSDWANSNFGASTPPITVTTPYGSGTLEARFDFFSSLYPVDTPFDYKKSAKLYFNHPDSRSSDVILTQDTYGRSGIPFILNVTTHHKAPVADCPEDYPPGYLCLPPDDPAPAPFAWSSQILFGARNSTKSAKIWSPGAGAKWPERPDLDLEIPRSTLERGPTASFVAASPVTIKPPMQDLLDMIPPGVKSLISDIGLTITVNPEFTAAYAAQLGLIEREGKLRDCRKSGESGTPCGLAEALLYQQTRAEGRMVLKTGIHLWIDFDFSLPFSDPDIDFSDGFTIPIGGPNMGWDPSKPSVEKSYGSIARASFIATSPSDPFAQIVKGLSGKSSSDIKQWTEQCMKTPPKELASLPEPTHEPGSADDLAPDLLPCNICVADSNQDKYAPFVFPEVNAKSYSKIWSCTWEGNIGCHDLCTWHKLDSGKAVFDIAVKSAVDIVGTHCTTEKPPVVK
jgi:hypothetical protein